jgi:hypothetical protein
MNAKNQHKDLSSTFNTNQILDSIKSKLFNTGVETSSSSKGLDSRMTSVPSQAQNNASANRNSVTNSVTNAPANKAESFTYDDFEDFKLNDSLGHEAPASFAPSERNQEINAAYRAYQGNNKYQNAIHTNYEQATPSYARKNNVASFEDFEEFQDHNTNESAQDEQFEDENDNEGFTLQNNVRTFPARPTNVSTPAPARNSYMPSQNSYTPNGSESINSVMARMLQKEIVSYISLWASQNNQMFTQYLQSACDQMAQDWCNKNMPSLLSNAVNDWCSENLENLCADVIRQELHKDQKTA